MLEEYIKLMQDYPIGTQIEIEFDGRWHGATVIGYKMFENAVYLITGEQGAINSRRVSEIVRKKL